MLGCKRVERPPKDYLVRLLDLKQKVLFASQETDYDLKYDLKLVQCMFLHSLLTGLPSDSIKLELKPFLQNTYVTDEELFEKLDGDVSNEMELQQKLGSLCGFATSTNPVPLVAQVTSTKETPTGGRGGDTNHPQKSTKPNHLTEVQEMKAELAAIRESIGNQLRTTTPDQYRFRNEERARLRECTDCLRERFRDRLVISATIVRDHKLKITGHISREKDWGCTHRTGSNPEYAETVCPEHV